MLTILLSVILCVLIYYKIQKSANFWKNQNITHDKSLPLIGNLWQVISQKKHFVEIAKDLYDKYPDDRYLGFLLFKEKIIDFFRYIGCMQLTIPTVLITDINLIKQIGVTDFDSFHDHTFLVTPDIDPFISKSLINLKGEEWKQMRATLSPVFTSSKMKNMYHLICECSENFTKHFQGKKIRN